VNVYRNCHRVISSTVILHPPFDVEKGSWDNVYAIVSGLTLGNRGILVRVVRGTGKFSVQSVQTGSGTKRASFLFRGYLGLKWLVHEAVSPPPSVVQTKNDYTFTSTPSYCFMACTETFVLYGRIMVQAVSRRPLTPDARFRSQDSGICGAQSGLGTGFFMSTSVFPLFSFHRCPFLAFRAFVADALS
jgi:hypothetical protein